MGASYDGLRPSEVVHLTIPDPAEQAPLVARSVTPPSPSGRGGTTLLRQRAPRSCTVFVMTPPNEHTSEGGRDDRGVPYHAESTLSHQCNSAGGMPRSQCLFGYVARTSLRVAVSRPRRPSAKPDDLWCRSMLLRRWRWGFLHAVPAYGLSPPQDLCNALVNPRARVMGR